MERSSDRTASKPEVTPEVTLRRGYMVEELGDRARFIPELKPSTLQTLRTSRQDLELLTEQAEKKFNPRKLSEGLSWGEMVQFWCGFGGFLLFLSAIPATVNTGETAIAIAGCVTSTAVGIMPLLERIYKGFINYHVEKLFDQIGEFARSNRVIVEITRIGYKHYVVACKAVVDLI